MALWKTKNMDEIDDVLEIVEAMRVLEVSSKGLKTLEEMKDRVRSKLQLDADKIPSWIEGKAFSIFSKAKEEDAFKRQVLLDFYDQVHTFLGRLDENMLALIRAYAGDVEEIAIQHIQQLTQKEYFLLVTGDTSSGKSSLINLILGEEILPYSFLGTTSTICELKFGEERKIVAHFKDNDPETGRPTRTITLEHPKVSSDDYRQQISSYVHQENRHEESIFEKIELFWPYDLLQKGIVIVDSPGFGESPYMDEMVMKYLPNAFAFIYVIDCANAVAVQKKTPETLQQKVTPLGGKKCSLYVCNKWDQVPVNDVENVKDYVTTKLRSIDLDPQSQIIYMSTTKAIKALNYGHITEGFLSLMNGIGSVVLRSIKSRLEFHWRWPYDLLSRIIFQAKSFVKKVSSEGEEAERKMVRVLHRLEAIEKDQDKVIDNLNEEWKCRVDGVVEQLTEFLSLAAVKAHFTSWTTDQVPKVKQSWEQTRDQITNLLKNRLLKLIEKWEEDNRVFATAHESLLRYFEHHFNSVRVQLLNLQSDVTDDPPGAPNNFWNSVLTIVGVAAGIGLNAAAFAFTGLRAHGLIAVMSVGASVASEVSNWNTTRKYERDPRAFMAETSADYLAAFKHKDKLTQFVKNELKEAELLKKKIEADIPGMIQADKKLYEDLKAEKRSKFEVQRAYKPLIDEGSKLRGNLALFGIKEFFANDIESEDLIWKEDMSSRLGSGAFGTVYQGVMRRHGPVQAVALKVCRKELNTSNAHLILQEVKNLRKLDHPNIVKFYGTSLLKDTARMILVVEKCREDLRSYILRRPKSVPGKYEDSAVLKEACQWLNEITDALAFLHEKRIAHRDLKLENILLSEENTAKIADVGLAKPVDYITGTFVGTVAYMAPEVFHSEVYDSKADIFSLGIMMWEIWYGKLAFADVSADMTLQEFFGWVDAGNRPEHKEGYKNPPLRWQDLMKQCWEGDPKKRPTAEMCNREINRASFSEVTPGEAVLRRRAKKTPRS